MKNRFRAWVPRVTLSSVVVAVLALLATREMGLMVTLFVGTSAAVLVVAVWFWAGGSQGRKKVPLESDRRHRTVRNTISGSHSGHFVLADTITGGVTSHYHGPVTFTGPLAVMNEPSARRALAAGAVVLFAIAAITALVPQTQATDNGEPATGADAVGIGETTRADQAEKTEQKPEIHCPRSGRDGAAMEAPPSASVTISPYTCLPAQWLAPSFMFPADEDPPNLENLGEEQNAMEPWAREQGYESYRDWAYAQGGVDADRSAVDFAVAATSEQSIDIMMVELSVLSTSDPMRGYHLPPRGAGPTDTRVLNFNLDDPDAPPQRYNSDHETGADWNFPLSVRYITGGDENDRRELFTVVATTSQSTVEWKIIVHLLVDNEAQQVVVDDNGKPFVTSSSVGSEEIGFSGAN